MNKFILIVLSIILFSCGNKKGKNFVVQELNWLPEEFEKVDSINPVLSPDPDPLFFCPVINNRVQWESKDVFNPAAVIRNDTLFLLYRAEDKIGLYAGTSRIGLAWSLDGLNFTKYPVPVFYPMNDEQKKFEWPGGCEDPRIVRSEAGHYFMTYTAYDGKTARLMVASSPDLYKWTKHGSVFANADSGRFINTWSKSGSIVSHYEFGTPVAKKINGKYWMYGGDTFIWVATSDDLIDWTPVTDYSNKSSEPKFLKPVFGPREKKFDSDLVEPGPPAMITEKGICLIYNSRNKRINGDASLKEGTYSVGYVLLDKMDPTRVIERSESYFMTPDKPYETNGQVNNVCFAEGLVKYRNKWFLYYGTADSKIAVAIKK